MSLSDAAGTLRANYGYAPFGGITLREGDKSQQNAYRFSSEYADEELGLIYYNYRHLNPLEGRWISRDPIAEKGGWNLMGFVGNSPVKLSDVLGLKWKSLQNGKNHYRATSDEDTLGSLAYKVSGYKEDWSCLWPVSPLEEIRDRYPQSSDGKVKKCDVYDISNLVKSMEEGERLGIYLDPTRHNVAQAAFSGSIYIDGGDVAQKIQSVSKEGKTPIGQFFLYGHCNSGLEYMSGNHGGNDFTLTSLLNKNEPPSFDRAVQMKGPLRCWFCIKTKARIQGCTTAHMAEQVAEHVFRKGSFVTGTNQTTGLRINNNVLEMGYNVRHNPTTGYDELINWGGYDNSNILVTYNGKL